MGHLGKAAQPYIQGVRLAGDGAPTMSWAKSGFRAHPGQNSSMLARQAPQRAARRLRRGSVAIDGGAGSRTECAPGGAADGQDSNVGIFAIEAPPRGCRQPKHVIQIQF